MATFMTAEQSAKFFKEQGIPEKRVVELKQILRGLSKTVYVHRAKNKSEAMLMAVSQMKQCTAKERIAMILFLTKGGVY